MTALFTIVLPIFALIAAGWLGRRFAFLGPTAASELNRFVVYFSLPALFFQIMAKTDWSKLDVPGFVGAFFIGCFAIFLLTVVYARMRGFPLADAGLDGLNAGYANVGFIGFPLCIAAFGQPSLTIATIASVLTVCVLFAIAIAVVQAGLQNGGTALTITRNVAVSLIKNPLLQAPVLGILYAALKLPMPSGLDRFLTLLAAASSPCALVSIGLFLAGTEARLDWGRIAPLVLLKLIAQPALTWVLATMIFHLSPFLTSIAVIEAALPTGTGPYMLADLYGRDAKTVAGSILVSTLGSVVTIPILLSFLPT